MDTILVSKTQTVPYLVFKIRAGSLFYGWRSGILILFDWFDGLISTYLRVNTQIKRISKQTTQIQIKWNVDSEKSSS